MLHNSALLGLTVLIKIPPSEFYRFPLCLKALEGRWDTQSGAKSWQSSRIWHYGRENTCNEIHDRGRPHERDENIKSLIGQDRHEFIPVVGGKREFHGRGSISERTLKMRKVFLELGVARERCAGRSGRNTTSPVRGPARGPRWLFTHGKRPEKRLRREFQVWTNWGVETKLK